MQEAALSQQAMDQMAANLVSARKLMSANHPDWDQNDAAKTVQLMKEEIEKGTIFMPEAAAMLISCLQKVTDWKLVSLQGKTFTGTALVSPDGAYATYPELVAGKAFRSPEDNTLGLFFNMVKGGELPPSEPGKYTILS